MLNKSMNTQDLISYRSIGKGQPLVLIHGAMANGTMFSVTSVAEELSKTYKVIIPDLAGHDASKNMPSPYTVERLANDVVKLLDSLVLKVFTYWAIRMAVRLPSR
jgi:pimeloyl-ACP methyl ester carboxylesterase